MRTIFLHQSISDVLTKAMLKNVVYNARVLVDSWMEGRTGSELGQKRASTSKKSCAHFFRKNCKLHIYAMVLHTSSNFKRIQSDIPPLSFLDTWKLLFKTNNMCENKILLSSALWSYDTSLIQGDST